MKKEIMFLEDLGIITKDKTTARFWLVKCPECNKKRKAQAYHIKKSKHTLCNACMSKYKAQTHGLTNTRLYTIHTGMKQRCYNSKAINFKRYGGDGIKVCKEWHKFENFYKWAMANGYNDKLSLDRIDSNKDYNPTNCRWATLEIQARNKRKIYKHNTSGYKGVSFRKDRGTWRAAIRVNNKLITIGTFHDKIEAAKAYDKYVLDNNLEHTTNFMV